MHPERVGQSLFPNPLLRGKRQANPTMLTQPVLDAVCPVLMMAQTMTQDMLAQTIKGIGCKTSSGADVMAGVNKAGQGVMTRESKSE